MPRSLFLLFAIAAFALLLTGCWDRKELNELGITSSAGVDWADDKWIITYQVIVPSGMWSGSSGSSISASQATVHVFTSEGRTIREAAIRSSVEVPRPLYFSHTDTLIIGRSAAEHGLTDIVELYLRSVESRETVLMAVTEERASDALKLFVPLERLPGDALSKIMMKEALNAGFYPIVRMFDFAQSLYSESRAIAVPEINLKNKKDAKSRKDLASIDTFKHTYSDSKLRITGQSVFKDGRRIGHLDLRESYGVSWLSDKIKRSIVAVPCPSGSPPNAFSSFRVDFAKTKVKPLKEKDGYRMLVEVKARGELMESECRLDLTKNEAVRQLRESFEQEIEQIMDDGWDAVKRVKADLPGFADKIYRQYPKDWKKMKIAWEDELVKLKVEPKVRISVIRIGLAQKPLKLHRSNAKG
ncbi:Ger(x)C family spore germination protein [Cohnella hongkongensis]|uniref:Ger(X)C family spore germination protein n=1 Tax=Cohnella hongkongensis TaxID=178337 RepID=A0ABV9FAD8_9BACL